MGDLDFFEKIIGDAAGGTEIVRQEPVGREQTHITEGQAGGFQHDGIGGGNSRGGGGKFHGHNKQNRQERKGDRDVFELHGHERGDDDVNRRFRT